MEIHTSFWPIHFTILLLSLLNLLQLCLTLCDPMDHSPPSFSVHGISQLRFLEWVVISFSRASSRTRDRTPYISVQFSCSAVSNSLPNPWAAACQASLSITNPWNLLKLMYVESEMPSNHLILCRPLLLPPSIFPSISVFQWVSSSYQVAKVLEFQLQHQSFQRTFRTDFL